MQNENESESLPPSPDYPALTSDIVSAYVAHNSVPRTDLAVLIASVHAALSGASKPAQAEEPPTPPVPINKTIRPDYIVSLEDGRQYRSLKRHLTARGLTPEQYRAKWGLRPDYPMVAPNYSKARSDLARALGLGQSRKGKGGARKAAAAEGGAKKAAKRARK
jgi:predicted transcriptional regulator